MSAVWLLGAVLISSYLAGGASLAVHAASFWHYPLYWWAYRHGAVEPRRFRRDVVLAKTLALAALAGAFLTQPWHWPSALVVALGFALNALAARALGPVRTYYGAELGDVSSVRVASFPYSVVAHPMLLGNIVGFGGTLLNPGFRAAWWPLACIHVGCNAALWVMETRVEPRRRTAGRAGSGAGLEFSKRAPLLWPAGLAAAISSAAVTVAWAMAGGWQIGIVPAAVFAVGVAVLAVVIHSYYVPGRSRRRWRPQSSEAT